MSLKIHCDGCDKPLTSKFDVVIKGERANGLVGGSPLPDHQFHWCEACAQVAFSAVANIQR